MLWVTERAGRRVIRINPSDGSRSTLVSIPEVNTTFTQAIRSMLTDDDALVDPRKYLGRGRDAVAKEVAHLLALLGAAGTAPGATGPARRPG